MRAPFQILAIPYQIVNGSPRYCVFHRADHDQWQFIAGGGEDNETPLKASPEKLRDLIAQCESRRDILEAPAWKQYIDDTVSDRANEIASGSIVHKSDEAPLVPAGAIIRDVNFGEGQVVALLASFPECPAKTVELPYLHSLPDEVSFLPDGKSLLHNRFGEGTAFAYVVVFPRIVMKLPYPSAFTDGLIVIE